MSAGTPIETLVVTSAGPLEGKTTIATNLAIAMAQSGGKVLLVDTDLRRPRIHRAFGLPSSKGITTVLVGDAAIEDVIQRSQVPGLDIVACGPIPPNPSELLHTEQFASFVDAAKARYDRVVFDSPPLGVVTDAAVLAPQMAGAVVVIRARKTTRDAVRSALRQLGDVGARVIGGVLNAVDLSDRRYGYGGAYYAYRQGGYYSQEPGQDEDQPKASSAAE